VGDKDAFTLKKQSIPDGKLHRGRIEDLLNSKARRGVFVVARSTNMTPTASSSACRSLKGALS
jgi:hypothetical protein